MPRQHLLRDYLIYIGIGLLVVLAAVGWAIYSVRRGVEPQFKNDWTVTISSGAIAFGYVLRNRAFRRTPKFWGAWFSLLLVHFGILLAVFSPMPKVPLLYGAALAPLELMLLTYALDRLLNHGIGTHK